MTIIPLQNYRGSDVRLRDLLRYQLIKLIAKGDAIILNVEFDANDPRSTTTMRPYKATRLLVRDCRFYAPAEHDPDKYWLWFDESRRTTYERMEGIRP